MSAGGTANRGAVPNAAIAFTALFFFGAVWGLSQPFAKIAVSSGHHPIGLIFWQLVVSAAALGSIMAWRRTPLPLSTRHIVFYAVIAILGTLIPSTLLYAAIIHLPAGINALAIATAPMMALMIALAVGNERFAVGRATGIALGVGAMMLIALPDASLPDRSLAPWLIVALIAPLCYALEGNYVARTKPEDARPIPTLFAACVIGAVAIGPVAFLSGAWVDLMPPWSTPEMAVVASGIVRAIAYGGYLWLLAHAGVIFSMQVAYVVTGSAIAYSVVLLGESYSAWVWAAVAMMAVGLFLVQPKSGKG